MIYFLYDRLQFGGAQTFIARAVKWFNIKHHAEIIYSQSDEKFLNYLKKNNIPHKQIFKRKISNLRKITRYEDSIICFNLKEYIQLKLFLNRKIKVVLYVLHTNLFDLRRLDSHKILKKIARQIIKPIIRTGFKKKQIVLMDELGREHIQDVYRNLTIDQECVFPLPYDDDNLTLNEESMEKMFVSNTILAIARADFPFKGYLLGLIRKMPDIISFYPRTQCVIISYGKDEDKLRQFISELDDKIQNKVKLIGETDYEELPHYYQNAKILIGMGSTLVEAAKYGLPAILAKSYTNELFLSKTPFYNNPLALGSNTDDYSGFSDGMDVLYEVLNNEKKSYYNICEKSRDSFINNYQIDSILNKFIIYCDLNL